MTAGDLAGIESALGITLPGPYRSAMLVYPLDRTDANAAIALPDDAKAVTAFNRFLREQFADDWRPGYLAIGNSSCGDPFFLDLRGASPAVWSWSHETHEIAMEAPDLGKWLEVIAAGG